MPRQRLRDVPENYGPASPKLGPLGRGRLRAHGGAGGAGGEPAPDRAGAAAGGTGAAQAEAREAEAGRIATGRVAAQARERRATDLAGARPASGAPTRRKRPLRGRSHRVAACERDRISPDSPPHTPIYWSAQGPARAESGVLSRALLSAGDGLGEPLRAGLGAIEHAGRRVLRGGRRGGAGDLQGSQFRGKAFPGLPGGGRISMDGRGRCMDNVFIERLWRSMNYEVAYLQVYELASGRAQAR